MSKRKKKQDEHREDTIQEYEEYSSENEVNNKRGTRIFGTICIIILAVIIILGILTFSFCLNFRVITGEAVSNILFWKMAN